VLSHDAVASERHGERAVRGESTEHGDEHPNPTQDRQCCAMEPRGKALERGAAERAEARTVAERSTGEAGGRSKRELLLEAYYSTPCSCCTCTAALLYVHFSAAAGGDRRRCSGRTIARLDVHRRRCWTCPVGPTGRALPALLDVHRRRCCTCTAARPDVHCCAAVRALLRCCTCTAALMYGHCCAAVRVPLRCCTCTVGAAVGVV
jgi:hypothetical protein